MYNPFRDYKRSTKKKVKKLEGDLSKLQQVVDSLLEELGYTVTTSVYNSEWDDYEVIKKEKKEDEQ